MTMNADDLFALLLVSLSLSLKRVFQQSNDHIELFLLFDRESLIVIRSKWLESHSNETCV